MIALVFVFIVEEVSSSSSTIFSNNIRLTNKIEGAFVVREFLQISSNPKEI